MTGDYKIILRDIVELFYHSPFKIFNVNSVDRETLMRPFGYFISLGITTSMESLKNIRDIIGKSDYGFEAKIVELESIKSEEYGDFLNVITNKTEEEYQQTYSYNDSFDFNAYFGSSSEQSYHEEMQQQQYTTTEPYVPYRKRRHDELHHRPEKKVTWEEIRRRSYTCFFLTNILFNVVHPHSLTIVDTSLKLELDIPYQSS